MVISKVKIELNKRNTVDLGDGVILIPDGKGNVTINVNGYEKVVKIDDLDLDDIEAAKLAKASKLPPAPAYGNQGIKDRNRDRGNKPQ